MVRNRPQILPLASRDPHPQGLDRLIAAAAALNIVVNAPDKSLTYPKAGFLITR